MKKVKPNIYYINLLLESDLTQFDNLNKLFYMLKVDEHNNFKRAHELNKLVKQHSARGSLGEENKREFYELNKKAYLFDAPYDFESFLIYLEWDREPEKRFYLPRRNHLKHLVQSLQDLEDDKIDILSISLPPGVGKSTLGCFFLAWVMGKEPDACNLASAHGDKLTKGFYSQILTIITDPEYLYKDIFPKTKIQYVNSKDEIINLNSPKRFATLTCRSIGGGLTGATRCEKYLYCDDLVSGIEEALNKDRLDTLWNKYTNDLKSRKKKNCKEIHIATRWSVWDVIGRLETQYENSDRVRFVSVPALDENDESNFDYKFGVGFDTQYFRDMRDTLDDVSWKCLYMNEPVEREGLLFPADDLFYYNGVLPDGIPDRIVSWADIAWGGGDYFSMPICYVFGEDVYVHDVVFNKGDKEITYPIVATKLEMHRPHKAMFEANNGGDVYADTIDKILRDKNIRLNISSRKAPTNTSKMGRIIQASPDIKKFYFRNKKNSDKEYLAFMKNLTSFMITKKNTNDDAPDSLAGICSMLFSRTGEAFVMDRPF